jgi:hypothetical protein
MVNCIELLHLHLFTEVEACAVASLILACCFPYVQIAMKELREKKIPFTIRRYLPDGR